MEKEYQDFTHELPDKEMDLESFFNEDEAKEWELEKAQRKKRKKFIVKIVSSMLVFALLISGLGMWFDVFNIPALRFVEVSNRLSKQPEVREYKKAVVTLEWGGVKGTGFNIASDGIIVTNEHVVENTNRVNRLPIFPTLVYHLVEELGGYLPLYQQWQGLVPDVLRLPSLQRILLFQNGQKIIFIGNPLAFTQIANEGKIVGKVRLNDWDVPVMMIEAPIYKGNSGSPVLNQNGEVIGIIFATLQNPEMETKEIIGAAIPSYYIKAILEELKE
ncbi:serine protease [Neobacillus sp. NPDC097160]|uniref:S1 family peptidase n=1 Tax=Neobacillus sp. NPDC097160 TaxID=3364298 RepID=UPI003807DF50